MLAKRPIYNQQLKCVAFEVLSSKKDPYGDDFGDNLARVIRASDAHLPLFVPFELKGFLEHFEPPIENPIILKLSAEDIDLLYPAKEIEESAFSIALLINTPKQLAWLNFAEYVGLTETLMSDADVSKVVQYSQAKQRKVIAYGLDKLLSFDKCKNMTMDYYCGDFLFKPAIDDQIAIAANKLNLLQLIQSLQNEDCDLLKISPIIQSDPLLSYQLLRVANSAAFSGGYPINSIEQAIARIGLLNLKNWVMLFSMKNISDKPIEVLESGLIRAHMAQKIAGSGTEIESQAAYTAGLLSILDCLINKPMTELITQITISDEISNALIQRTGPLGELLNLVIAYESGDWEHVFKQDVNGIDLSKLYVDSLDLIAKGSEIYS